MVASLVLNGDWHTNLQVVQVSSPLAPPLVIHLPLPLQGPLLYSWVTTKSLAVSYLWIMAGRKSLNVRLNTIGAGVLLQSFIGVFLNCMIALMNLFVSKLPPGPASCQPSRQARLYSWSVGRMLNCGGGVHPIPSDCSGKLKTSSVALHL